MTNNDTCRAVQLRELEILKEIIALCDRHDLCYFAIGGTFLGAVRHRGFIPWDDDMDIAMPREDYERFREIAPKELPEHLEMLDYDQTQRTENLFLKIHDVRTACIETRVKDFPERHSGVWVDIFPFDGYPGIGLRRAVLNLRLKRLQNISRVLRMPDSDAATEGDKRIFRRYRHLREKRPFNWASRKMDELMGKYTIEGNPYVMTNIFWFFPSCVFPLEKYPFEDIELPCPGSKAFLTALYGDYMTFPPEEERSGGHELIYRSLETSYREWDGSRNMPLPPVLNAAKRRLPSVRSQLMRYEGMRAGGWHWLERKALNNAYNNLWHAIADSDGSDREEICAYFPRVQKGLLRNFWLLKLVSISRLYSNWRKKF